MTTGRVIHEVEHFTLVAPARPHVDRVDGGHLVIYPKAPVPDRRALTREQHVELAFLTAAAHEAMYAVLPGRGVRLGRVNVQDNGNWGVTAPDGPRLHVHLYGRATDSRWQTWGQALWFPPQGHPMYDHLRPFTEADCSALSEAVASAGQLADGTPPETPTRRADLDRLIDRYVPVSELARAGIAPEAMRVEERRRAWAHLGYSPDQIDLMEQAVADGPPPEAPTTRVLAERHVAHYRGCGCLGDSAICCDPTCPCLAERADRRTTWTR